MLAEVWTDSENIWQNYSGWEDLWNSSRSAKKSAMSDEARRAFDLLPDEITIYRGSHDYNVHGLSWTLSRKKAEEFAERFEGNHFTTALAKKCDAHALFDRRDETELVTDKYLITSTALI